jgi:class 3 adenylate cyclase
MYVGIAVHLASRILDQAPPDTVMVSSTVKDFAYGSGIGFVDKGEYELRGVEERWRLFAVETLGQHT